METEKRAIVAMLAAANGALLPLYANMVAVLTSPSAFGRERSFPLALGVVLVIVELLRWRRTVGIVVNVVVAVAAAIALFWSVEPFAYLVYTLGLIVAFVLLHIVIYLLIMRKRA